LAKSSKRKTGKAQFSPGVIGVLDISRNGVGYVSVPGMLVDIIVRKENLKDAMHGDSVEVHIFKVNPSTKRSEAVVAKVVKRGQQELIGTVEKSLNFAFVVPDNKSFTKDIFIGVKEAQKVQTGDRVIVRIIDWNPKLKNPEGVIAEVLSEEIQHDIAMKQIVLEQGFSLDFPAEVLSELEKIEEQITEEEVTRRRDMRSTFTLTIDPHDAKDFDDAISLHRLENGNWELGVHIADVSHYVLPGTALDQEALKRATSLYLPDRVIPMLPEKISNELCSLRPKEDKLTFSIVFELNEEGKVLNEWMGRTVIHSNHRFTYEEVQEIIESKQGLYQEEVLHLHQISQRFRKERFKKGAINFSSEEIRFRLDENNTPVEVIIKENKACHQLIEELMLLANKRIAHYVFQQKVNQEAVPFPYRIHDSPDLEKLTPFAEFARNFGYRFDLKSPATIATSFNKMVADSASHPEHKILQTLGIRTMAKAVYSTKNIGHYGLAFEFYCHFTSPIRRYPDVLVHRVLQECLDKKIKPLTQMEEWCKHCSDQERKAMEAERDGNKFMQVEYMQKHVGDEMDAVISGVASFGFWAQTVDTRCEGFISAQQLTKDDYQFVESEYALVGKRSGKKFQIGQELRVRIVAANTVKKQIDMELID
jgi:ribonuclease R